ncbi:LmbE-like protein [Epithele typhae]|uniref:LmbE-like protein n=1 Tax=Epithele typhae TaxID=378194 RepID=UPI002008AAA0|nr:LmbE-like protein [Epithele typhae]KAH9941593.1 LmbE-like protein [Epithele typhae]
MDPLLMLVLSFFVILLNHPVTQKLDLLTQHEPANVLLLTAHPDDECMFFAPTLLALLAAQPPPQVFSLCLSVGNADGLGATRREELERSLDVLGIEDGRRWVGTPGQLHRDLGPADIAAVLYPYVAEHHISTILTFDHQGISSHPNHASLPHGVVHMLAADASSPKPLRPTPRVFALETVPLSSKYLGFFAPLFRKASISMEPYTGKIFKNAPAQPVAFVWFRWLYVAFSRTCG